MRPAFIIIFLGLVHIIAAKPFLENLLLQVATSLSSSTPDDPQSHVSDFRAQPKANSRSDRYEVEPSDEGNNTTAIEQTDAPPSTTLWNNKGFRIFPWLRSNNDTEMYSAIIGNIIGSARERITVAFQRLLSPLQRHRQQPHHQEQEHRSDSGSNEIDAASANLMNSLIKNETSKTNSSNVVPDVIGESKLLANGSEIQSEKMDHEPVIIETVISSDAAYQTKNKNNDQAETTSEFVGLALPIEESNQPKVSFQLDNDYAFETNESIIGPIQPEKGFLAKRLENISKRLNETRNQFRARTIQAVSSLVPLVQLVSERRGRKIVNSLETETTSGSLENYGTAKNNEENNFPLPPRLSRLSSNLLALHPRSKERRAALVFQNAFNKYAQLVINGRNASTGDGNSISNTIEQKEGNDNYSTDGDAGGANIAGEDDDDGDDGDDDDDDDDDEYENKDDIAGSIDNGTGEEVIDNNVSSRASRSAATNRMNMQSVATVGILILEVFGSIVGLTWGAFNQLQLLFS